MKTWHILTVTVLLISGCTSMFGPSEPPAFQEVHEKCMSIESGVTTRAEIIHHFGKPMKEFHSRKEFPSRPENSVLMYYFYFSMNHSDNNHHLTILIGDDERVIKYMHELMRDPISEPLNMEALKQLRKGSSDEQDIIRLLGAPTGRALGFDGNTSLHYAFLWETDSVALRRVLGALLTGPYVAYELITGDTGRSSAVLAFMLDENGKLKSVSSSQLKGLYERKDSMIVE